MSYSDGQPQTSDDPSNMQLGRIRSPTYTISIPEVRATMIRSPWRPCENNPLKDPGTARANVAVSFEHPDGTTACDYSARNSHRTVMQQHCDYWDTDHDSVIWPGDTYRGCRAWGWGRLLSLLAAFIINFNLSYPTCPGILPDPFFRIYLARIHKDKHGSDSMTYDNEGRFVPQKFEDLFAKYDRGAKGGLTLADLWYFWNEQRMVFDFFGWNATLLEWLAVYLLLWPEDGILRKDDIRGVYDGSIFYMKAGEWSTYQSTGGSPRSAKSL